MMNNHQKAISFFQLYWVALLICVVYFIYVIFNGEQPYDVGDGLQHYAISKQAWTEPIYFIDHWGKPLFILFSSAFAQLGFKAYTLFNVVVFCLTIFTIVDIYKHFRLNWIIAFVTPFIFISIPDYTYGVIGGLTEPFFGLLLTFMFWSAVKEKWLVFALIASFTPFARSEGALVLMSASVVLLVFKQWKVIPFLTVGFVAYAILGMVLSNQPMWYFENDPYPEMSPYGSGNWYEYLSTYKLHLGVVPVVLSPIMLFGWFIWRQKKPQKTLVLTLYFIGIYLGIIVIHSYFWAYGLRGSLGLSRIATQGLPVALTIGLIGIGFVIKELHFIGNFLFLSFVSTFSIIEVSELYLPIKSNDYSKIIKESCLYMKQHENKVGTIYYFHPLVAYFNNFSTKEINPKYKQVFIHLDDDVKSLFKPGDIIIRDSKFGAIEQGLPFKELKKYPHIVPIKQFYTDRNSLEFNGDQESIIIYEVLDQRTYLKNKSRVQQLYQQKAIKKQLKTSTIKTTLEYYNLDTLFEIPKLEGPKQTLVFDVNIKSNVSVNLVFDDRKGTYICIPIKPEKGKLKMTFNEGNKKGCLYLYNPSKAAYEVNLKLDSWETEQELGLISVEK